MKEEQIVQKYTPPQLSGHKVAYKGKRYWVIEIDEAHPFEGINAGFAAFVIYDADASCTIATAIKRAQGGYEVSLMSHVELTYAAESIRDMVAVSAMEIGKYMDAIVFLRRGPPVR